MGKASRERRQRIIDGDSLEERRGMTDEEKFERKSFREKFAMIRAMASKNPTLAIAMLAGKQKQDDETESEGGNHGDQNQKESRELEDK